MTKLNQVFKSYLLLQASYKGNIEEVKKLLDEGVTPNVYILRFFNYSPLMLAACLNDKQQALAIAQILIDNGAQVNHTNGKGLTALHLAAIKNNSQLVKLLIQNNADVNVKDTFNNETASDIAKERGFLDVLVELNKQKPSSSNVSFTK